MTIKELQEKREGKTYAENPAYGFQCVAWVKCAIKELYGINLGGFGGSAHNGFVTGSPFGAGRTKVRNTPSAIPTPGSVIFRSRSGQLPYGHVAIVVSADVENVTVIEQNAKTGNGKGIGGDAITTRTHDYRGVSGWYSYQLQLKEEIDPDIQALIDDGIFNGNYEPMNNKRLIKIIGKLYNKLK